VSCRIIVRPKAEADLLEAAKWYDAQRATLGEQFLGEISRAFRRLETSPECHPSYYQGFRRLLIRRFPFKVFYRIEGNDVIIVRVLHAKRDHRLQL
jgi:toxin ParE1/3/4